VERAALRDIENANIRSAERRNYRFEEQPLEGPRFRGEGQNHPAQLYQFPGFPVFAGSIVHRLDRRSRPPANNPAGFCGRCEKLARRSPLISFRQKNTARTTDGMQAAREIIMRSLFLRWDEIEEGMDPDGNAAPLRMADSPAGAPLPAVHASSTGIPGSLC
jgi:hypothetical protein